MANTKIPVELSSTPGIVDNSNATAITIDSSENIGINTSSPTSYANSQAALVIEDTSSPAIVWSDTGQARDWFAVAQGSGLYFNYADGGGSGGASNVTDVLVLDNSGNVGIGTSSPNASADLHIADTSDTRIWVEATSGDTAELYAGTGVSLFNRSNSFLNFGTNNTERMRIDSSGNLLLGTTGHFNYSGSTTELTIGTSGSGANAGGAVTFVSNNGSTTLGYLGFQEQSATLGTMDTRPLLFNTNNTERMRIDSSGNVTIAKTSTGTLGTVGIDLRASGLGEFTASSGSCIAVNRLSTDGALVYFFQDTSVEGAISVSGSTVTYAGFSGNHETSGISTDTEIGTVCSTIDELDTYVSGTKSGQTRADHAKIKISDTVGDTRVYGVLSSYSETDNKPLVASVGIGSVKVTGACSGGDLLESNGDGTAKVQSDDIVRSKTIGKVTIGNSDTGVKLVSCVLYCG